MRFPLLALLLSTLFEGYHWSRSAAVGAALVLGGNRLVLPRRLDRNPQPARLGIAYEAGSYHARA